MKPNVLSRSSTGYESKILVFKLKICKELPLGLDKNLKQRKCFCGDLPCAAEFMILHTQACAKVKQYLIQKDTVNVT